MTTSSIGPGVAGTARRPAEAGLWVFILLDLAIFTSFFATALYYRATDAGTYREGQAALSSNPALLNTFLLILGSLLAFRGVEAARHHEFVSTRVFFLIAALCGAAFFAIKVMEYIHLGHSGYSMQTNEFFLCYFAFTAVHLAHVGIGTATLTWVAFESPRRRNVTWAANAGNYWHMVDLLWLMLLPVLYLA